MIIELSKRIRNICNSPWRRNLFNSDRKTWHKIFTSLDAIEDTQIAINYYLDLDPFNTYNGGYLFLYGVLQAIFVQQDAVSNLSDALFNKKINYKIDYPKLNEIREIRNNSIGHPTSRSNDKSFHYIGLSSIRKEGFTLASSYPQFPKKSKIENINLIECIDIQKILIENILNETEIKLIKDFEDHKMKFKENFLVDSIEGIENYYEFLYSEIDDNHPLSAQGFEIICEKYTNAKDGIVERVSSINAYRGVPDVTDMIDYILHRLQRDLIENKISDKKELYIFIQSLENYFEEFKDMLKEIDKEFS